MDTASTTNTSSFRYRADVDGLRAVAVLLVVLYHCGLGFSGGYMGVDIFFVISGFLITGLILSQQECGTFRIGEFWNRRVRRIVPAASVVVLLTLIAGYFLLLPHDLKELAHSAIYQQLMASNFYFWHHTGYFDGPAELKPLLHTWSLAVEEQFYLIYPVVLVVLERWSSRLRLTLLVSAALLSFLLSWYMVSRHPGATFYSLPTRAWELLAGGILAALPAAYPWKRWTAELISIVGVLLILYSGLSFHADTVFPGPMAAIPCLGTVLIIASGNSGQTTIKQWLSWKPVVGVGLISYSLYLWHWPLSAFQSYWLGNDVATSQRLIVLVTSFLLAILSWRFIETPFRKSLSLTKKSGLQLAAGTVLSVLVIVAGATGLYCQEGLPQRLPTNVLAIIKDSSRSDDLKAMDRDAQACDVDDLPLLGNSTGLDHPISFVLWGDSHARALAKLCNDLAKERGIQGAIATKSGTAPLLGAWVPNIRSESVRWNDAVIGYLRRHRVSNVILVARWTAYANTYAESNPGQLAKALRDIEQRLANMGIQVWVMVQVPEQLENPQRGLALAAWTNSRLPTGVSRQQHEAMQQAAWRAFATANFSSSTLLDPQPYCFNTSGMSHIGSDSHSYYRDEHHLSDAGADQLVRPLLRPLFDNMTTLNLGGRNNKTMSPGHGQLARKQVFAITSGTAQ